MGINRDFSVDNIELIRSYLKKNGDIDQQFDSVKCDLDILNIEELDINDYLNDIDSFHKMIVERYNVGASEFEKILENVHNIDLKYQSVFRDINNKLSDLHNKLAGASALIGYADADDSTYGKVKNSVLGLVSGLSDDMMKSTGATLNLTLGGDFDKRYMNNPDDIVGDMKTPYGCLEDISDGLENAVEHNAVTNDSSYETGKSVGSKLMNIIGIASSALSVSKLSSKTYGEEDDIKDKKKSKET